MTEHSIHDLCVPTKTTETLVSNKHLQSQISYDDNQISSTFPNIGIGKNLAPPRYYPIALLTELFLVQALASDALDLVYSQMEIRFND